MDITQTGGRFTKYYDAIKTIDVRRMVKKAYDEAPDYYSTLKASTSGKFHGGELLVDHVEKTCEIMLSSVFRQMSGIWDIAHRDMALAAMLCHDLWRCGYPGKEELDDNGDYKTSGKHPEIGQDMFAKINGLSSGSSIVISEAIGYHYGPFGIYKNEYIKLPFQDVRLQVHIVDAHEAWNSKIRQKLG